MSEPKKTVSENKLDLGLEDEKIEILTNKISQEMLFEDLDTFEMTELFRVLLIIQKRIPQQGECSDD